MPLTGLNRQCVFQTFKYLNMFEHVDDMAEGRVFYVVALCKTSSDWLQLVASMSRAQSTANCDACEKNSNAYNVMIRVAARRAGAPNDLFL